MAILPRSAGIYRIDGPNDCVYIGSSANVHKRCGGHRDDLNRGCHHSTFMQRAWNKYGKNRFVFSVIELVSDVDVLINIEQLWLDILFTSLDRDKIYNTCPTAGSSIGIIRTPTQIENISRAHRRGKVYTMIAPDGTTYEDIESVLGFERAYGLPQGSIQNMLKGHANRRGWRVLVNGESIPQVCRGLTEEMLRKRSATLKRAWERKPETEKSEHRNLSINMNNKRSRARRNGAIIVMIAPDGTIYEDIDTISGFARTHGITEGTVRNLLHGKHKNRAGWRGYITYAA